MQDNLQLPMPEEQFEKRQVRLPVSILQNVIKISYGLMIVDCEDEIEF